MKMTGKTTGLAAVSLAVLFCHSDASAMASYRWKFRPLLVFADSESKAALSRQRAIVAAGRAGVAERNVVVVWIVGSAVAAELGPRPGQSAAALRRRFGSSPAKFRIILVGKDGGEKLTRSAPITAAQLFQVIDAMPMRRDEMRGR
jgi:hypothetical protein